MPGNGARHRRSLGNRGRGRAWGHDTRVLGAPEGVVWWNKEGNVMTADTEDRVACRTPAEGRDGTSNIPVWKYEAVSAAIRSVLKDAGPEGMLNKDLRDAVEARMGAEDLANLGKLGWHVVTVKLEMEVRGEVVRLPGKGPLKIAAA